MGDVKPSTKKHMVASLELANGPLAYLVALGQTDSCSVTGLLSCWIRSCMRVNCSGFALRVGHL